MSLLNLEGTEFGHRIDPGTYKDLNFSRLVSESTTDVLSLPCDAQTIAARQEVFRLLSDADCEEWFSTLRNALSDFNKIKASLDNADTAAGKYFIFRSYFKSYLNVIQKAENNYNALFLKKLNEKAISAANGISPIRSLLSEYESLIGHVSKVMLNVDREGILVSEYGDGSEISVCERTYNMAAGFGYHKASVGHGKHVQIGNSLSDAIIGLYPGLFEKIKLLYERIYPYIDRNISDVKGDIDFYLEINYLRKRAKECNIPFCFADISAEPAYNAADLYDISLILKISSGIVPNDVEMSSDDRVYFVTGANGGGKTTYLRAAAINLILFLSGCPVFAKSAIIYPFKFVFTHFPQDEHGEEGRLEGEEKRLGDIEQYINSGSFLFLNETFSGADEKKGSALALQYAKKLKDAKSFYLFVTHFHSVIGKGIPSLSAVVDGNCDNARTYKIVKGQYGRSSYANDILKKYKLDKDSLNGGKGDKND